MKITTAITSLLLGTAIAAGPALAQDAVDQPAPAAATPQAGRARNVILFLADAAGVATVNAASLLAYGEPMKLRVQQWPHLGLSETSPVDKFVSDSANGMSSIMTGIKTRNGVISQTADARRGEQDGAPTKTLLEYAEERGLLTGVITSQSIADATPAATYAHANSRGAWGEIFPQVFAPRFGDGVDVLIGAGRQRIGEQLAEKGTSFEALGTEHGRPVHRTLEAVPAGERRPIVVADRIDVRAATLRALDLLEQGPDGYLLVVEWDAHTDDPRQGLQNVADFDRLMAEVEQRVNLDDTLLLFTADHSFGLQVDGGTRGEPLMAPAEPADAAAGKQDMIRLPNVLVNRTHTAEEVPALATGAGAEQVHGYFPNTYLFQVMMNAFGWTEDSGS